MVEKWRQFELWFGAALTHSAILHFGLFLLFFSQFWPTWLWRIYFRLKLSWSYFTNYYRKLMHPLFLLLFRSSHSWNQSIFSRSSAGLTFYVSDCSQGGHNHFLLQISVVYVSRSISTKFQHWSMRRSVLKFKCTKIYKSTDFVHF